MKRSVNLEDLVEYLDSYLLVRETPDYPQAMNGLQVEGKPDVKKIAFAVDACLFSIQEAHKKDADILIVHHGLFWELPAPIRGPLKERFKVLLSGNLSLYSVHLPLDRHEEVGNNVTLARSLGFEIEGHFGTFQGVEIGVIGKGRMTLDELNRRIRDYLGDHPVKIFPFGPDRIERIGIVSGGGGEALKEAIELGLDAFLTGEALHHHYFTAEEGRINLILAGHYATEQVGLWSLMKHLEEKFSVETFFIDHPTGM